MSPLIEKLYVYEMTGKFSDSDLEFGTDFLGCWREGDYSYLFFSKPAENIIEKFLAKDKACNFVSLTEMDYDKWEPADALASFTVGPLTISPVWSEAAEVGGEVILLDPGVVFGAGNHHTTRKCLEFLVDIMMREKVGTVADLGTGTGILALAAVKLGAKKVIAVDNNNLAVETARRNARRNGMESRISFISGDAAAYIEEDFDLVIANIIMPVLRQLFTDKRVYRAGWYVVSGIFGVQAQEFRDLVARLPLQVERQEMENFWSTFLMKKF